LFAGLIAGAGDECEFDAIAGGVAKSFAIRWKPAWLRRRRAAAESYLGAGSAELNQNDWLARWAVSGPGVASVDDAGQVDAIDGQRDSFAKFVERNQTFFVLGKTGGENLVEPHEFGVEAWAGVVGGGGKSFWRRSNRSRREN